MRKPRTRRSMYDANTRVTNDLLPRLIAAVFSLRDCPSVSHLRKEMLSKFVSSDTDPAELRRSRAISKWLAQEEVNRETNNRLLLCPEEFQILPRVSLRAFFDKTAEVVRRVIGDVPPDDLDFQFTGGATTSKPRSRSYPAEKYVGRADITQDAFDFWMAHKLDLPGLWNSPDPIHSRTVKGNVMFTVPKTTLIDRVACKEPDINMFLQRGVGNYFRRRLRYFGIDLNNQSRNQNLAREGSVTGDLATLDLSSASDSITTQLCEHILPTCWYSLLMTLRSPYTYVNGEWHFNEMMSSMGNGFTFELESLLFYALARATAYFTQSSGVISVYGDDIIVPAKMADDLIFVLKICGFQPNPKKSFSTGPFRESCGGHYWNGHDITPFYVRKPIETLQDVILLGNLIRRWSSIEGLSVLDPSLESLWIEIRSLVPEQFWGGRDVLSNEALVTPHAPRKRLIAITSPNGETHYGDYAFSLHRAGRSEGRRKPTGRFRPGKNHDVRCISGGLWLHEI